MPTVASSRAQASPWAGPPDRGPGPPHALQLNTELIVGLEHDRDPDAGHEERRRAIAVIHENEAREGAAGAAVW
jgi:hypothetical protein